LRKSVPRDEKRQQQEESNKDLFKGSFKPAQPALVFSAHPPRIAVSGLDGSAKRQIRASS
jgi:hypothetical protein